MTITFAVDDVEPAAEARPTFMLAERIGRHHALQTPRAEVIDAPGVHPLLAAVHVAFAEHRPLVLTPDAIWLTIAQGVAQHVRLHAESLRPRLVRHAGRHKITVEFPGVPSTAEEWTRVVGELRAKLADLVGDGRARLLTCDFSTTTPEARVASEIVLMDVYAPYCDYDVGCICGIPEVTLAGTPEDWRAIRQRIDVIAELDLERWVHSLAPIADHLVATSEGRPDRSFWRDIYKPREAYVWDRVTGWIARLFPYLQSGGSFELPNPLLDYALGELPPDEEGGRGWFYGPGLAVENAPRGTSEVVVALADRGAGSGERDVILEGGLLGVAQDDAGRLEPIAGWIVRNAGVSMSALVDRMRDEGHRIVPAHPSAQPQGPAEIVALFRTIHSATLFEAGGAWRIRPVDEQEHVPVLLASGRGFDALRTVDLPDGTCLAMVRYDGTHVVRLATGQFGDIGTGDFPPEFGGPDTRPTSQRAEEVPILEGTLAEILWRALDSGGDSELPTSSKNLVDLAPPWALIPLPTPEEFEARRQEIRARRRRRGGPPAK
jgi:Domain of unknown function (DUF4419)